VHDAGGTLHRHRRLHAGPTSYPIQKAYQPTATSRRVAARLSTGLAGLDAQLGGGVLPGTAMVLFGEPMNALELFGFHFAVGDANAGTLYVTTGPTEEDIKRGVKGVGGRPERIKVVPLARKDKTLPPLAKGARYMLDNFSTFSQFVGFEAAFAQLPGLREQARQNGSALLVAAIHGMHTAAEEAHLKLWADGVLELGFDRQGFGLYPYLKVTKMRGVPDSARFLLFKETPKGLFMESTRRVF
jgi:archaeal flagellar protein FlaH